MRGLIGSMVVSICVSGCGPAVDAGSCLGESPPDVTHPDALGEEEIAAATLHARERLELFASPLSGYAFTGSFRVEHAGGTESSTTAWGLMSAVFEQMYLKLEDRREDAQISVGFNFPTYPNSVSPGGDDVDCPADLPFPSPGEPFSLRETTCKAIEGGPDTVFSIDLIPIDPGGLDIDDLLALNELQLLTRTPLNDEFEYRGDVLTYVDTNSYRSGSDDVFLYVDYEARWRIDLSCTPRFNLVSVDILHAESCNTGGHTHGRYDSSCTTIATIDGRPDWARGF